MAEEEDQLAAAESNIRRTRQIIERHKQFIAVLEETGAESLGAHQTLEIYETNLRILQGHRDYLKGRDER